MVEFDKHYDEEDYNGREVDLDTMVLPIVKGTSISKFSRSKLLMTLLITTVASFCLLLINQFIGGDGITHFYLWLALLLVTSIANSKIIPQRWIALLLATIYSFIPSMLIFLTLHQRDSFVFADYSAIVIIFPWFIGAYYLETKYLSIGITPKIPFISRI